MTAAEFVLALGSGMMWVSVAGFIVLAVQQTHRLRRERNQAISDVRNAQAQWESDGLTIRLLNERIAELEMPRAADGRFVKRNVR
jgi:hypothetical protein